MLHSQKQQDDEESGQALGKEKIRAFEDQQDYTDGNDISLIPPNIN